MPRKRPAPVTPTPAAPAAPAAPEALTPAERTELADLRQRYDIGVPAKEVMIPVPHHRLLRLIALERKDAEGAGR